MNTIIRTPLTLLPGLAALLLLAGCAPNSMSSSAGFVPSVVTKTVPPSPEIKSLDVTPVPEAPQASPASDPVALQTCQQQMLALKRIDVRTYATRRAAFDRLMSGAALYAGVRNNVDSGTRISMDALYQYKTGRLCADIAHDVLTGLSRQAWGTE